VSVSLVNGAFLVRATTRELHSLHLEHIRVHAIDALVRHGPAFASSGTGARGARDFRLCVSLGLGASSPCDARSDAACAATTTAAVTSFGTIASATRASRLVPAESTGLSDLAGSACATGLRGFRNQFDGLQGDRTRERKDRDA
jgi:hypothetical protein